MLFKSVLVGGLLAASAVSASCSKGSKGSKGTSYSKPSSGTKWTNACPTHKGSYVGPNASKCFPIIMDADAETDDVLAAIYLLKTPHADVRGFNVPGTGWAHGSAAANLADFADKIRPGSNIPVSIGAGYNLYEQDLAAQLAASNASDPNPGCRYQKSVPEGFTGRSDSDLLFGLQYMVPRTTRKWRDLRNYQAIEEDVKAWIEKAHSQTGKKVTYFITGPATNLAQTLRKYPDLSKKIDRVVWMGGALDVPGNLYMVPGNTVGEYNIYIDCIAAKELFANSGLSITLVPLDFTNNLVLNAPFLAGLKKLAPKSWEANFVFELLDVNRATWYGGDEAFYAQYTIWDPLAAGVMFNQAGKVTFETTKIQATCGGALAGDAKISRNTKASYKGATVKVAKTLETAAGGSVNYPIIKNFFASLL
ncbi:hypothetical protein HDV00_002484 [Rhizophlyctis rosea]|nr:hypothetical protein HDV00_002484 [Rhizophlyctis rosea]